MGAMDVREICRMRVDRPSADTGAMGSLSRFPIVARLIEADFGLGWPVYGVWLAMASAPWGLRLSVSAIPRPFLADFR
jgi:hypothetical protein